ncbi:MAG: futalosine hydrolase [Planctomycetes bacterium]|nr:futalosine hydrolase [Planctomycetota bacterium]
MAAGAPLLLVPTEMEQSRLRTIVGGDLPSSELCGFGPVVAAARTAELLAARRPSHVVLVGIAGTFDTEALPVGEAAAFSRVRLSGVGVGADPDGHLPFPQWAAAAETPPIEDLLDLGDADLDRTLLTVCRSSVDTAEAARRRGRWPDVVAEDMEAFGVATSCALGGVPLHVVRGISNVVGDRDHANWRIDDALAAAWPEAASRIERAPS